MAGAEKPAYTSQTRVDEEMRSDSPIEVKRKSKIFYSYSQPAVPSETPPHPRLLSPFLFTLLVARSMRRSLNNHHSCTPGISNPIYGESSCPLSFGRRLGRRLGRQQAAVNREWLGTDTDVESGRFFWKRWQTARNVWFRDFHDPAIVGAGTIGCDGDGRMRKVR